MAVLLFLSALLVTGSFVLGVRRNRPLRKIVTEPSGAAGELTPARVRSMLREKACVDINSAGKERIMSLPGIGEVLAGRIMEYRNTEGRFRRREDLLKVKGIGETIFRNIEGYIELK